MHEKLMREAMARARGAAEASDGMGAAATGRTENYLASAARISAEKQRAKNAKKDPTGLSPQEKRSFIVKSAQEMVKAGQKMLHVAEHERQAALHMIKAGEYLASTIPAPKMPRAGEAEEPRALFLVAP